MHRKLVPGVIADGAPVPAIGVAETARVAAARLEGNDCAALAVVDETNRLAGIVTERDLVRRVIAAGLDPDTTTVADIMTPDPDVLAPDDSVLDALGLMRARKHHHLPVVSPGGTALGIVSLSSLMDAVHEMIDADIQARETAVFGD